MYTKKIICIELVNTIGSDVKLSLVHYDDGTEDVQVDCEDIITKAETQELVNVYVDKVGKHQRAEFVYKNGDRKIVMKDSRFEKITFYPGDTNQTCCRSMTCSPWWIVWMLLYIAFMIQYISCTTQNRMSI